MATTQPSIASIQDNARRQGQRSGSIRTASPSETRRGRSLFTIALLAMCLPLLAACEPKKPVSLSVQKPIALKRKGQSQELTVTAKDKKDRPFIGNKPQLSATSSDASVVEVTANEATMKIKIVARNGGKAKITVSAFELETTVDVVALIAGKVKITSKPKTKLRIGGKSHTLKTEVLDAKGQPLEGIDVTFSVSDYCVTVDSNGLVEPVSSGVCTVTASAGGASDSITYTVR